MTSSLLNDCSVDDPTRVVHDQVCAEGVNVFDGFLHDPDSWRTEALIASYSRPHPEFPWYVSKNACSKLQKAVLCISRLLGLRLRDWHAGGDGSTVGRFHIYLAGAAPLINFHADPFDLAAILYLSPDPPAASGTQFLRTIAQIRRRPGEQLRPTPIANIANEDTTEIFEVANKYNRLVVFEGARYHRASGYFGRSRNSGRLTATFFFNLA